MQGQRLDLGWMLIFKAISDPVAVVDEYGWVIYANVAWDRLSGLAPPITQQPYHITKLLPAFATGQPATPHRGVEDVPMMLKDMASGLTAVTVSARPLPGESLWVVQARATARESSLSRGASPR